MKKQQGPTRLLRPAAFVEVNTDNLNAALRASHGLSKEMDALRKDQFRLADLFSAGIEKRDQEIRDSRAALEMERARTADVSRRLSNLMHAYEQVYAEARGGPELRNQIEKLYIQAQNEMGRSAFAGGMDGETLKELKGGNGSSNGVRKMPKTKKGKKIMANMVKEYGPEKAKRVFYASANKGTIKGVAKGKKV